MTETSAPAHILRVSAFPFALRRPFSLTHPTVSGILQRMEDKGFLQLQTDPDDHRCKRVVRTEKAVRCQQAICQHICESEQVMTAGMTDEEIDLFLRLMDRAIDNMKKLDNKEDPNSCSND